MGFSLDWCVLGPVYRAHRRFIGPYARMVTSMRFRVILEPSNEGGYTIYVPSLLGCISEGETIEEALVNIREAIKLYLEPVEFE